MAKSAWMIVPNLLRTLLRSDVALKSKLLLFAGLIYLISPVDLLPDVLVGIGWLDDLLIVPLLGWLSYRSLPSSVQEDVVPNDATAGKQSRRIYFYLGILVVAVIGIVLLGGIDGNVVPENQPLGN
ncbi:YkvA family protein [Thalassospira lucentensis]|uniref:YkvA family protein n=1 Tax=Thalassospira lucentensis TaxID=168935 RepID=UPI003D2EC80E